MPDSIAERITQDLETWLKKVQKVTGYANDFVVERRLKNGNAPAAGQILCVITQGQPQKIPDSSHDQTGWDMPYAIDIYVSPDLTLITPVDAAINSVRADAEKVIAYEEASRTRGGLAFDTVVVSPVPFVTSDNIDGIQVRCVVRYFTAFNDPYQSAYSNV